MHVENIDDDKLVLKTNHKDLNPDGLKLFLGDQIENLEKGVKYKFILVEDYVFSDEETNSYRIKEGLTIPKGEYLVYFDEQNIYLKYKLR